MVLLFFFSKYYQIPSLPPSRHSDVFMGHNMRTQLIFCATPAHPFTCSACSAQRVGLCFWKTRNVGPRLAAAPGTQGRTLRGIPVCRIQVAFNLELWKGTSQSTFYFHGLNLFCVFYFGFFFQVGFILTDQNWKETAALGPKRRLYFW